MENSYGIGVENRYALFLDDESDPLETIKLKEQEKELKKKTKVAEKENKVKTEAPAKGKTALPQKKVVKDPPNHKIQDNKREEGKPIPRSNDNKPERPYNKFNNENREERNNRRNREDRPYNGPDNKDERPRRDGDNFENRRGRPLANKMGGGGGGRGGPRRNFDDRRGKRDFDRQSGSDKTRHGYRGVKPVDKRDGAGAHNWGSHKDVIDEADKTNEETWTTGGENKPETTEPPTEIKEPEQEREPPTPVEEEAKELTLDEWKATQKAGRLRPQYNIRKAGEGEDPSQWKKMYELSKKKEEEEESEDEEYDASEYPQRVGRQKHVLDINIHFNDSRRAGLGRGRGGRGGGRGGRNNREGRERPTGTGGTGTGRGGGGGSGGDRFRGNEEQQAGGGVGGEDRIDNRGAPKVDDERDFPSLG
ncbi:SERPINE1 mRNA-binding protein 1-like isoform X3 [Onthophagus taurus]|uniref:SERPINE1 mRNA-binding protein 1-like isoform X3 n=1 Tax=Onthophagus taurus TaxID=166361 RepID=UPI000C1FEF75|nr:plasminogen activator inhibitor 1 RNA-binding protein-like isoform X3 [Onthophagus taurus]